MGDDLSATPAGAIVFVMAQAADFVSFAVAAFGAGGILLWTASFISTFPGAFEMTTFIGIGSGMFVCVGFVAHLLNVKFITAIRDERIPKDNRAALAKIYKNFRGTMWTCVTLVACFVVICPNERIFPTCNEKMGSFAAPAIFFLFSMPMLNIINRIHRVNALKAEADPSNPRLAISRDSKDMVATQYENAFAMITAFTFEFAYVKTIKCSFDFHRWSTVVFATLVFVAAMSFVISYLTQQLLKRHLVVPRSEVSGQFLTLGVCMNTLFCVNHCARGIYWATCKNFSKISAVEKCHGWGQLGLLIFAVFTSCACFGIMFTLKQFIRRLNKSGSVAIKLSDALAHCKATANKACNVVAAHAWAWFFFELFIAHGVRRELVMFIGAAFIVGGALMMVIIGKLMQAQLDAVKKATGITVENPLVDAELKK